MINSHGTAAWERGGRKVRLTCSIFLLQGLGKRVSVWEGNSDTSLGQPPVESQWSASRPRIWCPQSCTRSLSPASLRAPALKWSFCPSSACPASAPRPPASLCHRSGQFQWAKIKVSARPALPPKALGESAILASHSCWWPPASRP